MDEGVEFIEQPMVQEKDIVHRTLIVNNFVGRKKYTEVVLRCGDKKSTVRGRYDDATKATLIMSDERQQVKTGKKLKNVEVAISLLIPKLQLTLGLLFNIKFDTQGYRI